MVTASSMGSEDWDLHTLGNLMHGAGRCFSMIDESGVVLASAGFAYLDVNRDFIVAPDAAEVWLCITESVAESYKERSFFLRNLREYLNDVILECDFRRVVSHVLPENRIAARLNERLGFSLVDDCPNHGPYQNCFLYERVA